MRSWGSQRLQSVRLRSPRWSAPAESQGLGASRLSRYPRGQADSQALDRPVRYRANLRGDWPSRAARAPPSKPRE